MSEKPDLSDVKINSEGMTLVGLLDQEIGRCEKTVTNRFLENFNQLGASWIMALGVVSLNPAAILVGAAFAISSLLTHMERATPMDELDRIKVDLASGGVDLTSVKIDPEKKAEVVGVLDREIGRCTTSRMAGFLREYDRFLTLTAGVVGTLGVITMNPLLILAATSALEISRASGQQRSFLTDSLNKVKNFVVQKL